MRTRELIRRCASLAVLGWCAGAAYAETVAIVGATVHTQGPMGTLADATLLIEDGRIVAVGDDIDVPSDARTIDASGKVVTPGVFDPFSSLGLVEVSLVEQSVDEQQSGERYSAAFDVADAINPRSTLIPVNRIEGVTRALAAPKAGQEGGSVIAGLGAIIELGSADDYLVKPAAAMFATLGERGAGLAGGSRARAHATLREGLQDAADYRNNRQAFQRRARREYALSRPDLDALQRVLAGRTPLVVSVHRASDIVAALDLASEFGVRLVIEGGAEAWMLADRLADERVPVILNPLNNLPNRFESLGARADNAALLNEAGVTIAFSAADGHNPRNIKQSAGNAVAWGLPWDAALRAITLNPAEILGNADRYGTLEPGKDADVVVWSGDPLEVTTFADHVFIRGHEVPMESRQTLLRDRYMDLDTELPPAYLHTGSGSGSR